MLVCSVIISMLRGLVREVLSLASWVVALVVANAYGETLAHDVAADADSGRVDKIADCGFIALFIGTRLLMGLPGDQSNVQKWWRRAASSLIDPQLGRQCSACARGAVIVLAVSHPAVQYDVDSAAAVLERCEVESAGGTARGDRSALFAGASSRSMSISEPLILNFFV